MIPMLCMLALWQTGTEDSRNVVAALKKLTRVQVDFRQETYSDFLDETFASGTLKIARPGKLRMTYTRGERKDFICDGETYYEKDVMADSESRVPFEDLKGEPLVRLLLFGDNPEQHFLIDSRSDRQGNSIASGHGTNMVTTWKSLSTNSGTPISWKSTAKMARARVSGLRTGNSTPASRQTHLQYPQPFSSKHRRYRSLATSS